MSKEFRPWPCRRSIFRFGGEGRSQYDLYSGGTFRMGSDHHYPEEAPFIASPSTGSSSTARRSRTRVSQVCERHGLRDLCGDQADAKDYPGALPKCSRPARWCSRRPTVGRPARLGSVVNFKFGADCDVPTVRARPISGLDDHPVVHVAYRDALAYASGSARSCPPSRVESSPRAAALDRRRVCLGRRARAGWSSNGKHVQGNFPHENLATTATSVPRRSRRFRPTATASTT